jgi:outer membrane protein insertion porin family
MKPRTGKEFSAVLQVAGIGGNVRYIEPMLAFKRFMPMHYLMSQPNGRNVLGIRAQLGYVQGFGGAVAPPNNRFYSGGEGDLRGFDVRAATPYGYVPTRVNVTLTNPNGTPVPRDRNNPQECSSSSPTNCIQVPLPVYGVASIGGDTNFSSNLEYRIPIAGPVTFSFFTDFGIVTAFNKNQLRQSVEGFNSLTAPLYGCPVYNNGSCQGGISGAEVGFKRNIRPISGTNFVPRMSNGAEISVIMPVINAPVRLYYAYNPLRLYERPYCTESVSGAKNRSCTAQLITPAMFPNASSDCQRDSGINAGTYTYCQVLQGYGAQDLFREPRKTFRLTVSTTF